jgi:GT2 family glycosyltransferase
LALLNNDAVVEKNWLSEMVKVIKQDNRIGSVAPKILKYYKRDEFDSMGMKIRIIGSGMNNLVNEKNDDKYDTITEVFGPSGCSCLYKRDMLEDICIFNEYFDNDFFAFCEDLDLNWRARLRGWKSFIAPKSIVYHKGSESFQVYSFSKAFHSHRNRLFVILKNYPFKYFAKGMSFFVFSYTYYFSSILSNKGYSARTKEKIGYLNTAKFIIKGWMNFFIYLPRMIKKRYYIQKRKLMTNKDISIWFEVFGEKGNVTRTEYAKKEK